jgi:hypothetical protein
MPSKNTALLGMVAQVYNPSYLGRSWFKASLDKKFKTPHLKYWLGTVANTCYLRYMGKHK